MSKEKETFDLYATLEEINQVKAIKKYVNDVFQLELESETYNDCVQELKEIMRLEDEDDE